MQEMAFLRVRIFKTFPGEHAPSPPNKIHIHPLNCCFQLSLIEVPLQPCEKTVFVEKKKKKKKKKKQWISEGDSAVPAKNVSNICNSCFAALVFRNKRHRDTALCFGLWFECVVERNKFARVFSEVY